LLELFNEKENGKGKTAHGPNPTHGLGPSVRQPVERGRAGLLARLDPSGRPGHTVPDRARNVLNAVVTARRWGGAAGPDAPTDKVS
jgi:hypothetical protein